MISTRLLWLLSAALAATAAPAPEAMADGARPALTFPYLTPEEAGHKGYRALAARVARSYVRVVIMNKGGGLYNEQRGVILTASGTIIDAARGYVVTAAHIARGASFVAKLRSWDGREYDARVVKVVPKQELALLKSAPITGGLSVRFADSARLSKGDFALAIGTPHRRMGVATLGRIRLPNIGVRLDYGPWGFGNGIEISMEVENGHSGGPVFDAKGGLIGIVAGYELGDTTKTPYLSPRITYVVPSNGIAAFLRTAGAAP